jgi:protein-disulfide isomerase
MEDNFLINKTRKKWYRRPGRVALAVFLLLVLALVVYFAVLYFQVLAKMKRGEFDIRMLALQNNLISMTEVIDPTAPSLGNSKAPITIVEFGDFLCPICARSYPVMRELAVKHKDEVRIYWRNLPVIDVSSIDLMVGGACANIQGKFWPYHDRMFQYQGKITKDNVLDLANQIGLNKTAFTACLQDEKMRTKIQEDLALAEQLGFTGTPSFVVNGYQLQGFIPLVGWEEIIKKLGK